MGALTRVYLFADIDECTEMAEDGSALHDCDLMSHSKCVDTDRGDTDRGFRCECDDGFTEDDDFVTGDLQCVGE